MSWLSSFLNPGKGYSDAQKEYEKYYNEAQGYNKPYMQHGEEAYSGINEIMKNLMDPEALYAKWAGGYNESPAAKQAEEMAKNRGLDDASALGLMGSSPALQAIQAGTSRIGMEDRQNYLDNLMQKYMAAAGIGQGIYNTGANAAGNTSNNAMNAGSNQAGLKFGQTNAGGNLFGNLLGTGVGLFGGPIANGISNTIGKMGNKGWSPTGYNPFPSNQSPMPNYGYGV